MTENIVDFNKEKKSREKTEKKIQKSIATLQDDVAWMLDGSDLKNIPHDLRAFPHKYFTTCAKDDERPQIWRHDTLNNTATQTSKDKVAGTIASWMIAEKKKNNIIDRMLTHDEAKKAVESWLYSDVTKHRKQPKSVGYMSDPDILINRLGFDPDTTVKTFDDLARYAPMWHEMLTRMVTNRDAFCIRMGSILHECDRKQAVWISGPKDSGKSQIEGLLSWFMGGPDGAYMTVSELDLVHPWWTGNLPGKRVVTFEEAAKSFLNSNQFKAFTGSTRHSIVSKCVQPRSVEIDPLFFFFSNDHPGCHDRPEIIERVIYCQMQAYTGDKMIDAKYQQALRNEGLYFFGYCENMFQDHGNGRIKCEMDDLKDVVDFANEQYFAPFWKNFELDPDGWVLKSDLTKIIDLHFQDRGIRSHVLSQWMSKFGLIPKRCKNRASPYRDKVALRGVKVKNFTEPTF